MAEAEGWVLPQAVEQLIEQICREQNQTPPGTEVRQELALLGEEEAVNLLRKIAASTIKKTLSAFIMYMIRKPKQPHSNNNHTPSPHKVPRVSPLHTPSSPSPSAPASQSQGRPVTQSTIPERWSQASLTSPNGYLRGSFSSSLENAVSPKLAAWGELEFRKAFLILSYIGKNQLEHVDISADEIRSLKHLGMVHFEERVWKALGQKYIINYEDRRRTLDWDMKKTHIYHCHVSLDGKYKFKGPYLHKTKTHLQRVLGDENVLVVKFAEEVADRRQLDISWDSYSMYNKIASEGIVVGFYRYRFFVFKDGGKEEKKKDPTSSSVKCFFIRKESIEMIYEARSLFMHAHRLPSVANYMARFSLILSKTTKLEVDLASVNIQRIEDVLCTDQEGKVVYEKPEKPRIHTDGTGFISEDLALICGNNVHRGERTSDENIATNPSIVELESNLLAMQRQESKAQEPPLLIQFRLFNNGCAVKGTLLVNKKLPPRTIQVRPSMIKVETDPKLSNIRTVNSLEIVGTSNQPKKTYLSRNLIALLSYGGVPKEYFMDILSNALSDAHGVLSNKGAALRVSVNHGEMDDFSVARMILSGIPLDESYLQHRLSILMKEEKKSLKGGKLHVPECYYLMGTVDPTGLLESDEVCVILDNGQISGKVLVYRNPGLHFGDIHVLKATYVKALESFIGNAKFAIFFPCKGPRSLGDEIAGGDFDGDMYWVSRNPQLLEHFKVSEPWTPSYSVHKVPNNAIPLKKPTDFSSMELEQELFKLFLSTRFQPSYAVGVAADSWLALMDRLLILGDDCTEEKVRVKANILKLIDIYYDALDAPKKGGQKIEVPRELKAELFPHYMERDNSFNSTSILGLIYDTVNKYQTEDQSMKEVRKLPCFDVEVPEACMEKWKEHYEQYRQDMTAALQNGCEGKNEAADEVIKKYKMILYGATEFEERKRGIDEVYNEALAIYHVTYDYANHRRDAKYCFFVWRIASSALLNLYAKKQDERSFVCLRSVLREIFN
ncbi:probable RNA-dependent RNA polymerase 5 [Quercus robur]|uniref:probable RNA-dependent RNA polymerase 5 n=1 Tax=Quercus robur TaxID=38942 RepID=UPI0021638F6E|nr:probable RNA-dependent RNA polymerase 5 [Quercus robur]XP_050269514.1 probable RNA-dependent RNA polymerase 5 [Quercus robur]